MNWNEHSLLKGTHAEMSASQHSWLNYDEEKLINRHLGLMAKERGTKLHEFAEQCILLDQRLEKKKKTINMYAAISIIRVRIRLIY